MRTLKKKIKSKDYRDYVIKNGKFIGAFEEMYQNIEDPWHHGDATHISYDMALYLLDRYKICAKGGEILDVGCGKGAFTARLKKCLPKVKILAIDITPTAIRKAKEKYKDLGICFDVMDIQKEYKKISKKFDLIVMSEIMWYVLPNFEKIVSSFGKNLKKGGHFLIRQTFYQPRKQKYGNEVASSVEDMLNLIKYKVVEMVEVNRLKNHSAIVLFKK